jgi:hypothetical protein
METKLSIIQNDKAGLFIPHAGSKICPVISAWLKEQAEKGSGLHDFCMQIEAKHGGMPGCSGKTDFCAGESVTVEALANLPSAYMVSDQINRYKEVWFMQDDGPTKAAIENKPSQELLIDLSQLWALAITGSSAEMVHILDQQLSPDERISALGKLSELNDAEKRKALIDNMTIIVDAVALIANSKAMHPVERWQILRAIGSRASQIAPVIGSLISTLGEYRPQQAKTVFAELVRALNAYKSGLGGMDLEARPRADRMKNRSSKENVELARDR